MSEKGEAILQELAEQVPVDMCEECRALFPTEFTCWLLVVSKGRTAQNELLADHVRDHLEQCPNTDIVGLVQRYRAES